MQGEYENPINFLLNFPGSVWIVSRCMSLIRAGVYVCESVVSRVWITCLCHLKLDFLNFFVCRTLGFSESNY